MIWSLMLGLSLSSSTARLIRILGAGMRRLQGLIWALLHSRSSWRFLSRLPDRTFIKDFCTKIFINSKFPLNSSKMNKLLPITILLAILVMANMAVSIFSESPEKSSPSDTVKEGQIQVFEDRIVINVSNAGWAGYRDSNSMDPVIDSEANGIVVIPESEDEINVGDIVSYTPAGSEDLVVHRIVNVGSDDEGRFYTLKGDNNSSSDPDRVRF